MTPIDGKGGLTINRRLRRRDTRAPSDEQDFRYRLHVAASNVIDLIAVGGGWLADRAMAGWDVTGFIADFDDDLPLQILGIDAVQFHPALDLRALCAADSLAITPDVYDRESRVCTRVSRVVTRGEPGVIFLGGAPPPEVRGKPMRVEHQCSLAAVAFKGHALAAAGAPTDNVTECEVLFGWPTRRKARVGCRLSADEKSHTTATKSGVGDLSRSQRATGSAGLAVLPQRLFEY